MPLEIPSDLNARDAIGFLSVKKSTFHFCEPKALRTGRTWCLFHNGLHLASYLFSPLVGLIRIVVAIVFLIKGKDAENEPLETGPKNYLKALIARGALELIGGGYFLWIADIIHCRKYQIQFVN